MDVKDRPGLLTEILNAVKGSASISLEGNLQRCSWAPEFHGSTSETTVLKRATLWPKQDFVVLPIEEATIKPILKEILKAGFDNIVHVQVEKDGRLLFIAYDNFCRGCVAVDDVFSATQLQELISRCILREFWPADSEGRPPATWR